LSLLLLFISTNTYCQDKEKIDSLLKEVRMTNNELEKHKLYLKLSQEYISYDSINKYAKKSLTYFRKNKLKKEELKALFVILRNNRTNFFNVKTLKYADSVKKLATELKDTLILSYLHQELGILYERKSDYKNSVMNLELALLYARKVKDSLELPDILSNLGFNYSMIYKDSLSLKCYKEGLIIANKTKNIKSQCFLLNNIGSLYYYIADYKEAIKFLKKSIILSKKLKLNHILNSSYGFLGKTYYETGKLDKALDYFIKAIELAKKRNDIYSLQLYEILLGDTYSDLKDYKNSLNYYFQALKVNNDFSNKKRKATIYNSISRVYIKNRKIDSAIIFNKKCFEVSKNNKNCIGELSEAYKVLGDINFLNKKYKLAIKNYKNSSQFFNEESEKTKMIETYVKLGHCYGKINKPKLAINYYNKANKLLVNNTEQKKNIIKGLINNYKKLGYISKALDYSVKYISLNDSLNEIIIKQNANTLKTKYQTKQKEAKILKLSNENLKKEAQLAHSKNIIYGVSTASLLTLGTLLFFWYRKKQQLKLLILEQTIKAEEEEKKRIGRELHDGIAGSLVRLAHDTEDKDVNLSHKLLETYNEIRKLSHQLDNSPSHGEIFLERLMEILPENKDKQTFKFKISPTNLEIDEPYGTHIYRIVQELITNNLKHAKATETSINIVYKNKNIIISYQDNGIGIDKLKKGNGFKNIEKRVIIMKGKITFNNTDKKGFGLTIEIPYKENNNEYTDN